MASSQKKVSVQELTDIISQQAGVSKKFSEQFLRELIDVVAEYLERDGVVKVKGLGTFKLTWVDGRRSVDVSTGKEIVLPPHFKVGFTPETAVKQSVNEPYAHLDTVVTEIPDDLASGHDAPVADKTDGFRQMPQDAAHDDDTEENMGHYKNIYRLWEDEKTFYVGMNEDDLLILPKENIEGGDMGSFKDFILEKSGAEYRWKPVGIVNKWKDFLVKTKNRILYLRMEAEQREKEKKGK